MRERSHSRFSLRLTSQGGSVDEITLLLVQRAVAGERKAMEQVMRENRDVLKRLAE